MGIGIYGVNYLMELSNPPAISKEGKSKEQEKAQIELGTYGIKGEKLWQNDFDERLDKEKEDSADKFNKVNQVLNEIVVKQKDFMEGKNSTEQIKINELSEKISWLEKELVEQLKARKEEVPTNTAILGTQVTPRGISEKPKDSNSYIPAGTFISGILRGGISASTGLSTPGEPTPIFIQVTGYGDLPQTFNARLIGCRLVGDSYGILASERINARVRTLSCTDRVTGLVTETEVVGVVHASGNDSKNGLKGTVISMSDKHLKNAMIGGLVSGFAETSKHGEALMFNPSLGAVSQKKSSFKEKFAENSMVGVGNAAEKIADYHLKLAEATAPVIEVPGAAQVTVFFQKGVFLGSKDTIEEAKRERK
jgi:hypothetical protein